MRISQLVRVKRVWVAAVLLAIGVTMIFLAWQFRLDYSKRTLVDRSLLTDIPCPAPCWQGIVPGETSRSQALQILRDSPYLRHDSLQESGTDENGGVTWQWDVPGRRLTSSISWQDGVVQSITLGLTYDLTVDQVIGKFGPPEAIDVIEGGTPEHNYWIIDLYYPHVGVQFKAYTPEFESSLEPSTEVGVAQFFVPTSLEERVSDVFGEGESAERIISRVMGLMRPWQGYGDLFEVYYESPQDLGW